MDLREELRQASHKLRKAPEYRLMRKGTDLLRGAYDNLREFVGSEFSNAYESNDVERELPKSKKTTLEKARKLLEKKYQDLQKMSLEEIIIYTAKCEKVKRKIEGALSVKFKSHDDWKFSAKELPAMEKINAWEFRWEPKRIISPVFPIRENDISGKLCVDCFWCMKNEEKGKYEKHKEEFLHVCKYGVFCSKMDDPEHAKRHVHLEKPICSNRECDDYSPIHRSLYAHRGGWDFLYPCRDKSHCTKLGDCEHLERYTHEQAYFPSIEIMSTKLIISIDNEDYDEEEEERKYDYEEEEEEEYDDDDEEGEYEEEEEEEKEKEEEE